MLLTPLGVRAAMAQELLNVLSRERKRVVDLFRQIDVDNSGDIDRKEFIKAIQCIEMEGDVGSAANASRVFDEIDVSRDGSIELDELVQFLRRARNRAINMESKHQKTSYAKSKLTEEQRNITGQFSKTLPIWMGYDGDFRSPFMGISHHVPGKRRIRGRPGGRAGGESTQHEPGAETYETEEPPEPHAAHTAASGGGERTGHVCAKRNCSCHLNSPAKLGSVGPGTYAENGPLLPLGQKWPGYLGPGNESAAFRCVCEEPVAPGRGHG